MSKNEKKVSEKIKKTSSLKVNNPTVIRSKNALKISKDDQLDKQKIRQIKRSSWKEKQRVSIRVKNELSKNATLPSKTATKNARKNLKKTKKNLKLSHKKYILEQKKHTQKLKDGNIPLSINHIVAKKQYIEDKNGRKVAKRVYRQTKKTDETRLSVQLKMQVKEESKLIAKQEMRQFITNNLKEEDTLKEGVELYQKQQRLKQNMRIGLKVGKNTGKLAIKTGKGAYGLGNRLSNFSRGRGFQRTPSEFTTRKQLMKKYLQRKQQMQLAKEAKKAEQGVQLIRSVMNGQKTMMQAIQLIVSQASFWGILIVFILSILVAGVAIGSQKPAIVQTDKDLTDSWTYMTRIDAENTDSDNVFYSNIDDVMFYMNYRFDDYSLTDRDTNYEDFLANLWYSLNGKSPNYTLKTMKELETNTTSTYYLPKEEYEQYQEVKTELGYTTLDDLLVTPFQTDSLIVSRRYGYEYQNEKNVLFNGIELLTEVGKEFNSPLKGKIISIPTKTSFVIEDEKNVKLTITGVKTNRLSVGDTVESGVFLGAIEKETVTIHYEKYNQETNEWFFVNPAFYFPNVTYTQVTLLDISDFSPNATVEKRAKKVYDYLTNLGYTKEGICAILGNFSVESGINPKRAEGDYLNPPIGASANSWDDSTWLSMGGMAIYGRYPNIIHRGLGLGQWTDTADGGRRHTLLLDYAKSKNKKWYDLELQLDFIFNGDAPGSRTYAKNVAGSKVASTIPELTVYFLNYWEGNPNDKVTERIQAAQNWFNYFSNTPVDGSSSEVFEKYKDKMKPLPTEKETKAGKGWEGNAYQGGNCTWYVYNRMKQLGKSIHPTMGNANQWVTNYTQTAGASLVSEPKRGDIVIFTNGVAGTSSIYGHVAVIEHVNSDGTFVVSEMNVSGEYSMGWRVLKKEAGEYFMRIN